MYSINFQHIKAKKLYPEEYEKAIKLSYPQRYLLFGCRWLNEHKCSDTALKYFLQQWERYVGDVIDIYKLKNIDDLSKIIFKYRQVYESIMQI